jgi:2-amino-4-hydroxy-6-hydroxymethyldihydropteridine diphosphokinase
VNRAVIGIGSNIEAQKNIGEALRLMADGGCFRLLRVSQFLTTKPVGHADQPDFVNGAALVETELDREPARAALKDVETALGRVRGPNRYGPRTIDLDIVAWNGTIVDADYHSRDFLRAAVDEVSGPVKGAPNAG